MLSMEKPQVALVERYLHTNQQQAMWKYWNEYGTPVWGQHSFNNNWFKQNTLFDFFQGGDWTKYLNKIGIYNIQVIDEFNLLMANGLRLHHCKYKIGNMKNKYDISTNTPNWNKQLVSSLLTNKK
jgi:hypothetical protein